MQLLMAMSVHNRKEPRSSGLVVDWGLDGVERERIQRWMTSTVRGRGSRGGSQLCMEGFSWACSLRGA